MSYCTFVAFFSIGKTKHLALERQSTTRKFWLQLTRTPIQQQKFVSVLALHNIVLIPLPGSYVLLLIRE